MDTNMPHLMFVFHLCAAHRQNTGPSWKSKQDIDIKSKYSQIDAIFPCADHRVPSSLLYQNCH